jgi:hypothetical protein
MRWKLLIWEYLGPRGTAIDEFFVSPTMPCRSYAGNLIYGDGSKRYLVSPKIAGKWMFIPLKMYL